MTDKTVAELMALVGRLVQANVDQVQFCRNYGRTSADFSRAQREAWIAVEQAIRRAVDCRFEKLPPPDLRTDPPFTF